jgi:hypothetical protein
MGHRAVLTTVTFQTQKQNDNEGEKSMENQRDDNARRWLMWGLLLSWTPLIPVAAGLLGNPHGRYALSGVRDLAGSVIIAFTIFGLPVTGLSQVAAIILSGVCIWMLLGEVVMR